MSQPGLYKNILFLIYLIFFLDILDFISVDMSAYIQHPPIKLCKSYLQDFASQIAAHVGFEPAIIRKLGTITTGAPQWQNFAL